MLVIKIRDDIFKTEVYIITNCTPEEANKYLAKFKNKQKVDVDNNSVGQLIKANHGLYRILYLRRLKNTPESLGELTHELFHLVIRICEDKGVPNVPKIQTGHCGDETGAYLIEHYFNYIVKEFKKATARKGKGITQGQYDKSKQARERGRDIKKTAGKRKGTTTKNNQGGKTSKGRQG